MSFGKCCSCVQLWLCRSVWCTVLSLLYVSCIPDFLLMFFIRAQNIKRHNKLLNSFRELYVKYAVEHLGFSQVYATSSRISDGFERVNTELDKPHSVTTFLQYQRGFRKGGGIILLEVGSSGAFACCKLHVMNASRDDVGENSGTTTLPSGESVPVSMASMASMASTFGGLDPRNNGLEDNNEIELNQELFTQASFVLHFMHSFWYCLCHVYCLVLLGFNPELFT